MDSVSPNIVIKFFLYIKDWIANFAWLLLHLKQVRESVRVPVISKYAKLCPQCDKRMSLGIADAYQTTYRCVSCDTTMVFLTETL